MRQYQSPDDATERGASEPRKTASLPIYLTKLIVKPTTGILMRLPNFIDLREGCAGKAICLSYAQRVHPNPQFYKYYWWVFWARSPVDGFAFLSDSYRLNTAAAIDLMAELRIHGDGYWLYNHRIPRRNPANPFDLRSPRWQGVEWAASYDDDPDPMAPEPLATHR